MRQNLLFSVSNYLDVNPLMNFQLLFDNLKGIHLTHTKRRGRKPIQREAILNGLIFKSLKSIPTLTELVHELRDNPSAALCCGFDIRKRPPSVERFSAFLRNTNNKELTLIRNQLVHHLIELQVIDGKYLAIDSCPILANVKENNLKTNTKNRFDKTIFPKGDLETRLGVLITFPQGQKKVQYFWGYRNHTVTDTKTELPIWEITKPANVQDSTMFIPIFDLLQKEFNLNIEAVMADGIYDTAAILKYVIHTLKAKPRIAQNPRNTRHEGDNEIQYSKSGNRICEANLEMLSRGTFYDKSQDRWRQKWVCPVYHSKKIQKQYIVCPIFHPKFFSQKGCYAYRRIDDDHQKRNRLRLRSLQQRCESQNQRRESLLPVANHLHAKTIGRRLNATANHCTIAHITVLLVALTAAQNDFKEQVRFIKSFLPNFNP